MSATPFVLEDELKTIHPVSRVTRWRQEKAGSFPKRINLSPRTIAWRRADIEAWQIDPPRWADRLIAAE
ncbi:MULTISPECIES: helix-turn-helix transcriptional regulator [unclassified Tardiphaga]|uniref:helix-turn-helix transcriptional regulator n=1 Tax=unclassified Tardiphaga TaxID=2631404 RepID=UPI00143D3B5B|nr:MULTISPECIES: AlpA family phage regulatory protein [unclassified Tardiphaga]